MDKNQLKEFMNAIGAVAETTLIFYRSIIKAGGTQEEAMRLTQALISATIFGDKHGQENGGGVTMNMTVEWNTRLCTVKGETGYFHTWEHYSKPLPASPLVGGEPAGLFSQVFGIVEFKDGIRRVDPTAIISCDEQNAILNTLAEKESQNDRR